MNNSKYLIISLLLALPFSTTKASLNNAGRLSEYSLSISNMITYFNFQSGATNKIKMSQVGINWYESFSPYFHAGLEFGYTEMSQVNNSVASAQFTSGQYAGLLFRFSPISNSFMSFNLNLNYRYNNVKGRSLNQESWFKWSESSLSGELHFLRKAKISLFLASEYWILSGNENDTGNINQNRTFIGAKSQNFRIGTIIKVNPNGEIRVEYASGLVNGIKIHFARTF